MNKQIIVAYRSFPKRFARAVAITGIFIPLIEVGALYAQTEPRWSRVEIYAGSDLEDYLRVRQLTGNATPQPLGIRGFSPGQIESMLSSDRPGPWSAHFAMPTDESFDGGILPPIWSAIYNSAFPFGGNDGATWAGKGLTTAVQAGVWARLGPLTLTVAPTIFRAENAPSPLRIDENVGEFSPFADPKYPIYIDLPQRFGDQPYVRLDPGQSSLRLDLSGVVLGVSTANHYWGPARENPLVLGSNAAGFPSAFLGTSAPVSIWIGKLHGRLVWGSLGQSAYSPMPDSLSRRFVTGAVAVFQPKGMPGLEVGGSRFFHNLWPGDGLRLRDFAQPFESLLKIGLPLQEEVTDSLGDEYKRSSGDNQIASVFARWVFPESGFEIYGEFAREDHNYDFRDLVLEVTHNSGYMFGVRKGWALSPESAVAIGAEVLNTEPAHTTLARDVPQFPFYLHGTARQGHTQYGQALGSAAGYGGAEALLMLDVFDPAGRWHFDWRRTVRDSSDELLQVLDESEPIFYRDRGIDVIHSVRFERLMFVGKWDVSAGVTGAYNFNRHFLEDVANLNVALRVRTDF